MLMLSPIDFLDHKVFHCSTSFFFFYIYSAPGSSNRYSPIMNSLSQMFTNTSAVKNRHRQPPPMGFLSDGGHLENLGMLAMFVRQAGLIVCGDGGADAKLDLDGKLV